MEIKSKYVKKGMCVGIKGSKRKSREEEGRWFDASRLQPLAFFFIRDQREKLQRGSALNSGCIRLSVLLFLLHIHLCRSIYHHD